MGTDAGYPPGCGDSYLPLRSDIAGWPTVEAICPIHNQFAFAFGALGPGDAKRPPVSLLEACIWEGVILIPSHLLL
jgi:hypothetical protein